MKITDFGLSRELSASRASESIAMTVVGTPLFFAPELRKAYYVDGLSEAPYSKYSDIWACGCVSYYMLKKKVPGNNLKGCLSKK